VLPFQLKRSKEEFGATSFTTTTETVHGLLNVEADTLTIQWRTAWKVNRFDTGMSTDEEIDEVREVRIPLRALSGAFVRRRWWEFWLRPRIVLTASDLQAFEPIAGEDGLRLNHPAELELGLRWADRLAGEEFAAELQLAVAQRALEFAEGFEALEAGDVPADQEEGREA
jgi:hypothetical protein